MNIFKSPILWAVIGISALVFGFMTSDEDTYPTASKFSGWLIIAGAGLLGFTLSSFIRSPFTKLNVA